MMNIAQVWFLLKAFEKKNVRPVQSTLQSLKYKFCKV